MKKEKKKKAKAKGKRLFPLDIRVYLKKLHFYDFLKKR